MGVQRSIPLPRAAIVFPPAAIAASTSIASTPIARPEMITRSANTKSVTNNFVTSFPYSVIFHIPTKETKVSFSLSIYVPFL
jgi:hypothetical protein